MLLDDLPITPIIYNMSKITKVILLFVNLDGERALSKGGARQSIPLLSTFIGVL